MSDFDAYDYMGRFLNHSDSDLDRIIEGKAPAGDCQYEDLASFLMEARTALTEPPSNETEESHLAAIIETSSSLIEKGDLVVRPASKAIGPVLQVSGLPKQRSGKMKKRIVFRSLKLAAVLVGLMLITAGLAFAGVDLPGTYAEDASRAVLNVDIPNQGNQNNTNVGVEPVEATKPAEAVEPAEAVGAAEPAEAGE